MRHSVQNNRSGSHLIQNNCSFLILKLKGYLQMFSKRIKSRKILLVLITILFLFGCRHQSEIGLETILTLTMPPDEVDIWREFGAEFKKENPGITLEVVEGPKSTNALETLYTTSLLSEDPAYDLLYLDIVWTPKFAAANWLEDLTDLLSRQEWDDFLAGGLSASTYRSHIYRLPVRSDTGILYYRKDLLEQAGLL